PWPSAMTGIARAPAKRSSEQSSVERTSEF
ncbi:MAG: hypothetical protein ACI9OJ_004901, partial [Myxococcota bacterium]